MGNPILKLGNRYSKKDLSLIFEETNISTTREGIYYCKKRKTDLLFVDFEKQGKEERFHFNDFFEGDVFHWDSQTTQHIKSPKIVEITTGGVEVLLFARIFRKVNSNTQPFIYCGKIEYLDFEEETIMPVHLIFQSLDYNQQTTNPQLKEIYEWKPQKAGKQSKTKITPEKILDAKKRRSLSKPTETVRLTFQNSRVGQDWYRQELLKKWGNRCAVTGIHITDILIASHIKPWKDCNNEERLDENNGILLSPNLDALFDKNLISFNESGNILINNLIKQKDLERLGITHELKLRLIDKGMKKYLEYHRSQFNKLNYL